MLESYVKRSFKFEYKATIGADFLTKKVDVKGETISANIWDTAGQEKMGALNKQFYRGSDGCAIVFDLCDKASFNDVEKWVDAFLLHSASRVRSVQEVPYILIGNKSDLLDKIEVTSTMAKGIVKLNGFLQYFETSAKDLKGVDEAFNYIIAKAVETMPNTSPTITSSIISLSEHKQEEETTPPPKKCC